MPPGKRFTAKMAGGDFTATPDIQINYEKIGQWKQANFMLAKFPFIVNKATNLGLRDFCVKYAREVRRNIQNQGASLGWEPLSPGYQEFKERWAEGDANQMLNFFGVLSRNIRSFKVGNTWAVGIKSDVINEKMSVLRNNRTLTVAQYAGVLEKGSHSRNIPARPLWQPSFYRIGGRPELTRLIATNIRKLLPSVKLTLGKGTT